MIYGRCTVRHTGSGTSVSASPPFKYHLTEPQSKSSPQTAHLIGSAVSIYRCRAVHITTCLLLTAASLWPGLGLQAIINCPTQRRFYFQASRRCSDESSHVAVMTDHESWTEDTCQTPASFTKSPSPNRCLNKSQQPPIHLSPTKLHEGTPCAHLSQSPRTAVQRYSSCTLFSTSSPKSTIQKDIDSLKYKDPKSGNKKKGGGGSSRDMGDSETIYHQALLTTPCNAIPSQACFRLP